MGPAPRKKGAGRVAGVIRGALGSRPGGRSLRVLAARRIIETEVHASGGEPGKPARVVPSVPMKRSGRAEEVAEAILWLLSEAASYTTGTILDVAGGR